MIPIALVDHRDSFTHNVAHALTEAGATCRLVHADQTRIDELLALDVRGYVLGPGPCTPAEADTSRALADLALRGALPHPLLGICLGHQIVGVVAGASLGRAQRPLHGRVTPIHHDGVGIFTGLPSPVGAARYNSLALDAASLPPSLVVSARDEVGEVMALRHRDLPIATVQFHPESWLDEGTRGLLAQWLRGTQDSARTADRC